jgi:hypothetical protein
MRPATAAHPPTAPRFQRPGRQFRRDHPHLRQQQRRPGALGGPPSAGPVDGVRDGRQHQTKRGRRPTGRATRTATTHPSTPHAPRTLAGSSRRRAQPGTGRRGHGHGGHADAAGQWCRHRQHDAGDCEPGRHGGHGGSPGRQDHTSASFRLWPCRDRRAMHATCRRNRRQPVRAWTTRSMAAAAWSARGPRARGQRARTKASSRAGDGRRPVLAGRWPRRRCGVEGGGRPVFKAASRLRRSRRRGTRRPPPGPAASRNDVSGPQLGRPDCAGAPTLGGRVHQPDHERVAGQISAAVPR